MDHALIAACALLLNAAFGAYVRLPDTSAFLRDLERRLNREHRSPAEREGRGTLLLAAVMLGALLVGAIGAWLLQGNLKFLELGIVACLLPVRPVWDAAAKVRAALASGHIQDARQVFADSQWRHYAVMDEYALARASIETLAVKVTERIVSPVLWYVTFGLPGLLLCSSVTLLRESWSQPLSRADFGKAAQFASDVLHYLPSRVVMLLWLVASLFISPKYTQALVQELPKVLPRLSSHLLALTCAACVLRLSLGGPGSVYAHGAWVGGGTHKALPADIRRMQHGFALLCLFVFVALGLAF